jgi:predicted NBD/HSP70 family sugar kinase
MHEAVGEALDDAGTHEDSVLVTVVGVPAPVDDRGRSPVGDGYWARMNPGIINGFARRGHRLIVDNDANLAAIAEGRIGAGVGASSFATLLSGERFGAGLIIDGALLRGRHGGAGEMHVLDLVEGVGSADGLAAAARKWARDAIEARDVPKRSALLRNLPARPEFIDVVTAAQAGETAAIAIVDRLADRLARVCAVLSGLLDVERIIIGGALAATSGPVIERATTILATYMHLPVPELTASTLGADSVNIGAVQQALSVVREDPLAFDLQRSPDIGHSVDDTPATTRA